MEQIGGISEFKIKSNTIEVEFPKYSWLQDEIFYYAIPRKRKGCSEILLAPVYPKDWNRVWEIMFDIKADRPGIIFELTDLMAKNGINILKQEGLTPSEELQYSFWLLVKLTIYTENNQLNTKNEHEISQFLIEDLNNQIVESGIVGIKVSNVKEIELLYENHYAHVSKSLNEIPKNKLIPFFEGNQILFEIKDYKCTIPTDSLFAALGYNSGGNKRIHGAIFTDFSQKNFFILRLFEPHQKIIFFDIRHKHTVGAIRKLSDEIRTLSQLKYNILYNRVTIKKDPGVESDDIRKASHWYVLLELQDNEERINAVFESIETLHGLSFGLGKSIRIIDYTDNLKQNLNQRYRRKIYAGPNKITLFRTGFAVVWTFTLLIAVLLILSNHAAIMTLIKESPVGSALIFLFGSIVSFKDIRDMLIATLPKKWID